MTGRLIKFHGKGFTESIEHAIIQVVASRRKMENIAENQLGFALHPVGASGFLDAAVFAQKVSQLLRALAAADKAVNGKSENAYWLFRLSNPIPSIVLSEYSVKPQAHIARQSGIAAFDRCAAAIVDGDASSAQAYGDCARQIVKLTTGADGRVRKFSYGEVWAGSGNIIRIDAFLNRRAIEVINEESALIAGQPTEQAKWFRGVIEGRFEGELQAIDLRGAIPECALVVGPGNQIDCVFREELLPKVANALASRGRVRVWGRAIYDGRSGLPARLQMGDLEEIEQHDVDFLQWRGSFQPFPLEEWEDNEP